MKQTLLLTLLLTTATALTSSANDAIGDSLLPVHLNLPGIEADLPVATDLQEIETGYAASNDHRKAFLGLVGLTRIKNRKLKFRIYNDLAGISARLKLYPLAIECYYNALQMAAREDSSGPAIAGYEWPADSSVPATNTTAISTPISIADLLAAFQDGKEAASYAILAEVKQPVPGKRRSFTHINNVGHMFITLIKYNKDKSVVCRSFGFYPHKSSLFSATPICPHAPSVVKDDAGHDWDEAAGKFISSRRFARIVDILRSYDHRPYDLNRNNCTDFGLTIARLGGIEIADASGHWPLGKGNNPGSAGQSMLEGKVSNTDQDDPQPLFVARNLMTAQR